MTKVLAEGMKIRITEEDFNRIHAAARRAQVIVRLHVKSKKGINAASTDQLKKILMHLNRGQDLSDAEIEQDPEIVPSYRSEISLVEKALAKLPNRMRQSS